MKENIPPQSSTMNATKQSAFNHSFEMLINIIILIRHVLELTIDETQGDGYSKQPNSRSYQICIANFAPGIIT